VKTDHVTAQKIAATSGTPVTLATTSDPTSLAGDGDGVYWISEGDTIMRVAKTGGDAETIVRPQPDVTFTSLAAANDAVFWTGSDGQIHTRAAKQSEKVIVSGEDAPASLSVHADRLYWIDTGNETLRASGLDGANPATIATGVKPDTVYVVGDDAVFAAEFKSGEVWRVATGKPDREKLAEKQYGPTAIALAGDLVYWANSGAASSTLSSAGGSADVEVASEAGSILHAPRDAHAGAIDVMDHLDDPTALSIDGDMMTYVSFGKILRVSTAGGEPAVIVDGERVRGYVADASGIYWSTEDGEIHGLGSVKK
jgi:hypothetical protein